MIDYKNLDSLGEILLKKKLISPEQHGRILSRAEEQRKKLSKLREIKGSREILSKSQEGISPVEVIASFKFQIGSGKDYLTEEVIMQAVAEELGVPFKKIDPLELDLDVVTKTIPKAFALKHLVVPLALEEDNLTVAMFDPQNHEVIEDIMRMNGLNLSIVVSTRSDILKTIHEFYGFKSSIVAAEKDLIAPLVDLGNLEQYTRLKSLEEIPSTDKHIKNAVDYLLHYAFEQRASDIHIEPKREDSQVRLRIDGVLHPIYTLPKAVHPAVISRIKTLSRLNIAEKRRPQDGRMKIEYSGKEVELRISTVPVAFGEKAVLRLLNPDVLFQDLGELGFFPFDLIQFRSFLEKPHGIILVTGPTGSGKTTTLYSALRYLSTPEKNIVTIEDPIEMVCSEFNQIAVQPQVDITFANSLRSILRQDPDIIMVGEIRDQETADNAIQAALTGHLVLSTLHTNDSASSLTRLIDLGVEPFLISSTLIGVLAQRLVRKICPHCEESFSLNSEDLQSLGFTFLDREKVELKRGKGCINCRNTGYWGRSGVFEALTITPPIKKQISQKVDSDAIKKKACEDGMTTLRENAIKKMLKGATTYQEVLRITAED
ncbi:MAG: ATPase, T2SS/T4P/T4SS family [Proteobacteria bacterium]|nr:ATPase, T2SS/T4P/T4SS family [Pseudomonadota bacterium]